MNSQSPVRVLFVCLGNICRSPTAEGLFQHCLQEQGLEALIEVDSAGTGAWHVGNAPDKRARESAIARGYDISHLRARQVTTSDFERFDYILAMDNENLQQLKRIQPDSYNAHIGLFLAFGRGGSEAEVPDPYYGGEEGFDLVLDLVSDAAGGLISHIKQHHFGQAG